VYSAKDLVVYIFFFSEKNLDGFAALSNFCRAVAVKSVILETAQEQSRRN
jgi:hypothetical protein